ncbi:Coagulation factor XIII B chain [Holothuria leucospilota]|uniref:Coagulation factor XIII B chain n=1 Tax=Holothuria leucospilota TaxID=206669 RepID=A0A9Q0YRU9_HOLLE|nr:Coagulation factor XIII B chain [Holothuria leucospilota]
MCTQCRIFVLVLFCLFLLVCGQTTTTPSCDTSTQCSLNDTLLIDITCTESSYGQTNISDCYDQYFSFSYCKCTDPNGVISATNVTYWCNTGGQWDPGLFSLVCYASCTTDAESNVISQNPAGEETNIILHGQYVNYSCPEGYTGVGTRLVPCVDGSWGDHETYDCLGSCSLPDNYEFVDSSVTDPVPHGTVVEIKCIDGYTPSDPITSECNDGVFQDADTCRIQGEASTTTKQSTNLISSQRPEATTAAGGTLTNTDASLSTTHSQTKLVTFLTETDATRRSTTDLVTYAVTDSRPLSTQQNTIIVEETGSSTNTATTETAATKAITDTDTETVTDGATQQVTKITDIDTESATNGVPFTTFQVTEFVTETGTMTDVTGATETATDGKTEPVTENVKETDHITDQVVTDDSATEVTTNAVTEPVTEVKSRTTDQTTESVEKTDLYATESITETDTETATEIISFTTEQVTDSVGETDLTTDQVITENDATESITETDTGTVTAVTNLATKQVTEIVEETEVVTDQVITETDATESITETDTETATEIISFTTEQVTDSVGETDLTTDQVITENDATESITETDTGTVTAVTNLATKQVTEIVEETEVVTDQVITQTDATESITETDTETVTEIISFTTEQVTDSVGETDLTTNQVITENDATESITETDTGTVTAVTNLATKQVTEIVGETEVVTDQVITETDATESITETDTKTVTEIISFTTEQVTDSVGETDLITDRVITETDATESITGETEVMTDHVVTDQVVTETGLTTAVTETDTVTTTKVASLTTELLTEIVRETDPVTGQVVTETDATESITETDTETATEFISLPTEQVTNIVSETEGISLTSEQVTEIVGESDSVTDQVVTETDATESITTSDTETATDVISLATEQATKTGEITELVTDQMVTDTDCTGASTQSNTAILTGSKAITESDTATATETTPTSTQQYTNDIEPTSMVTDEVITVTDALTDSSSSARSIVTGTAGTITDRFGTDATETTSNMTATSGLGAETDVVTRVTLTSVTASTNSSPERSTETATDASVPTVTNTRVTEVPTSHPTVTSSAGSETPEMQYTTTAFTGPYKTDNRTTTFTTEPVVTTEPITTAPTSTSCENPLTNQEDTDVVDVTPYKFMYENGVEIKYFCPSGYSLEGESIAVCDSGSWNPPGLPSCKAILCPKPEINDSNVVLEPSEENYEQGADVEFTCPDGLILVGIQTATCDDGGFILEEEPQCVETVDSSLCSQPETSGEVIITPSLTFYDVGDVVTFSCANIGLTLSSTQSANCSSSGQWSVPIPTCELCKINEKGQCSGKSNNVCNGETGLCTCPPGQVLNGDRCITKTAIITIATLEGNFTSDLEDSSSEYYDTLGAEICLAFQTTLTKRNTNVKLGFVSCFVLSFTSGSIVANVATEYDEAANVTADQVTDILLVELQGNKNQLGNYSIPGLSLNFSSAPNSSETVITNNACETKTDICDPTYGMCTFLNGSLYTCSCIDAYDYYEQSISTVPGVACFVLDGPNYSLVIGLALGISLVLMASIMFGVAVLGPWCTKRNHKTYINRKKSLSDGSEDDTANRNDYVNGAYTINALENGDLADKYLEAPVDEKKMEAIASIIEHMGETAPIPRAVLMEETSFSSRESESNNGVHQPPN